MKNLTPAPVAAASVAILAMLTGCAFLPKAAKEGAVAVVDPAPPTELQRSLSATQEDGALARLAIARSLPFIEAQGVAWMRGEVSIQEGAACVSCHHVNYAVWGLTEAQRIGLEAPGGDIAWLTEAAIDFMAQPDKARSMSIGPMLLGMQEAHAGVHPVLAERLVDLQTSSGRWRARGQFPDQRRPVAESDAVATMWSLLVLPDAELASSEAAKAAMAWLQDAPAGVGYEWLAAKMLLAQALGDEPTAAEVQAELLAGQNPDGGWGWLPGDASNAFSTGQALYALSRMGLLAEDGADARACDRAQRFLIADQSDDGSWPVPSAAISSEPNEERDVIYHFWGTAWATIGLARSLSV